ncbi:hypothetical protein Pmar_PMAR027339 [Perkinsus marinus ATCC 50983]|uniref:Uncharacterized protein n=1 Tax=Perkinsus marinus (strain ATCC 50983 / TXsc) TaxID=423536 RepID=C5M1Q5_PERM5|nr:hypothetical protein Pmar_PMAR027339 [Perkinsus marinus ATCC 50983]EEQ97093.1 hypothetical protein Pmar_PMAR027339 [Perkinsus marinus ATCC 50983]|eukprot:XP_002764376.1 hypothetical protein Pmar_PMAR027339 [Perkinsus marinus ATCC 50983]
MTSHLLTLYQVLSIVLYPTSASGYDGCRQPDWYYCAEHDPSFLNRLFFTSNVDGTGGYLRSFLYDAAQHQATFYTPYQIDEAGYITFGDGTPGHSINDTARFPYMSAEYTLKYDAGRNSVTATGRSGLILRFTPQACSSGSPPPGELSRPLSAVEGGPPPLYPFPYYCGDRMCFTIGISFNKWIIWGWISTEPLVNTPCWHAVTVWSPFDVTKEAGNVTAPFSSFHFTIVRVDGSVLKLQPHNSDEHPTLLQGYNNLPYHCPLGSG